MDKNDNHFGVCVTRFRQLDTQRKVNLYDGSFTEGPGLVEYSEKWKDPGYFTRLEDVADAIIEGIKEQSRDMSDLLRSDIFLEIDSNYKGVFPQSHAYADSSGCFIQEPLSKTELEELVKLTHARLKSEFYEKPKKLNRKTTGK